MDVLALVADVVVARGQVPLQLLLEVVARVRLGALALEQRLLVPSSEHVLDVFHIRLECEEYVEGVLHDHHRLAHEVVDRVALPGQVLLPLLERPVDGLELRCEQRLLHFEHRRHDVVIFVRDQLQVAALHAVRLCLLVELERHRGRALAQLEQVLDLAQQAHELLIEVDGEQPVRITPKDRVLEVGL